MIWDEGDANPLHRRIPGEVVSRRHRVAKKPEPKEPEEVVVDLKAAIMLKPEARLKWLTKACKMVSDNLASSTDLYDIVVNRKFVSGMPDRVVRKISTLLQDSMDIFSDKQQRYLSSTECPIQARLTARDDRDAAADAALDDGVLGELLADDAVEKAGRSGAPPSVPQQRAPPPSSAAEQKQKQTGSSSGGSTWEAVKDEWAIRRQEAESKEQSKRDAARRAEKAKVQQQEEEAASRRAAEAEAERQRKLAEEADALFSQAISAPPMPLMSSSNSANDRHRRDRKRSRSLSRSRSISSRTARRLARQNKSEKAQTRGSWHREASGGGGGGGLSGSRAILLNRNFQEDLPHMPRPSVPGTTGYGPITRDRSRSRERERRRR